MIYNIKKLKTLRKFNLTNIYELTTKTNIIFKKKKHIYKEYKLPTNIKILKILYDVKDKKLKYSFNKFLFVNIYKFLKILKSRLDFVLFNNNLFSTINQSKQNISHKHIFLNNTIARHPSYCVKNLDIIHLYNISCDQIIKKLIYNHIIRNITINKICRKTCKPILIKQIILKFDMNNLNNTMCNKNFKIQINKTKTSDYYIKHKI
ncbi:ribosomal protein S4 (apicoplast) [Theileria parva strain Muguga]|uniref:Ribosomal protein S4, putative n=1 Tax=Theileria parva TaxID=5875 RepID=Q4MYC2_THEPA|eukprot:XP_762670.1 ribosomal protein S4 (apicoplast) [Theileria parva strain Muguga]